METELAKAILRGDIKDEDSVYVSVERQPDGTQGLAIGTMNASRVGALWGGNEHKAEFWDGNTLDTTL